MSLLDKIQKHHVQNLLESVVIVSVALVLFFFAPSIKWSIFEGVYLAKCYYNPPRGHGMSLGAHRPPEVQDLEELWDWPPPSQFFDEFVLQSRPVVFRNVAQTFTGFELWSDEYLQTTSGKLNLKSQNSTGYVNRTSFESFLQQYQKERIFLQDSVPDKLLGDLSAPSSTFCGNFSSALRNISFWMNGGNQTLPLSGEPLDTILCNFQGSQTIILINRMYESVAKEAGGAGGLDEIYLDLCWKRNLQNLPWHEVKLQRGDCLYLPSRWHKQIKFEGDRCLGVTFEYLRLLHFNQSDCDRHRKGGRLKPARFEQLLTYEIISLAENHAALDLYTFKKVFHMPAINNPDNLAQLFKLLDQDGDREVNPEELYSLQPEVFLRFFPGFRSDLLSSDRRTKKDVWVEAEVAEPWVTEEYED